MSITKLTPRGPLAEPFSAPPDWDHPRPRRHPRARCLGCRKSALDDGNALGPLYMTDDRDCWHLACYDADPKNPPRPAWWPPRDPKVLPFTAPTAAPEAPESPPDKTPTRTA